MPSFHSPSRNYILTTSYKVMSSTLDAEPSLVRLPRDVHVALRVWLTPGIRRYLLVRNPYDRLVSFHADKFRWSPPPGDSAGWQHCQRIFFPMLGLSGREGVATIAARLQGATFGRFLEMLPRVYRRDPHLWPQSWSVLLWLGPFPLPAPLHRIFLIERDLDTVRHQLGLELTAHGNATVHPPAERLFTAAGYEIANELYRRDFERFGYRREGAVASTRADEDPAPRSPGR